MPIVKTLAQSHVTNPIKNLFKKIAFALALATAATSFSALGLWQWNRAQDHQDLKAELSRIANLPPVSLTEIQKPRDSLSGENVNRIVTLTGRYLNSYIARNQDSGDYQVALFAVNSSASSESSGMGAILIARQLAPQMSPELAAEMESGEVLPQGELTLSARLLPSQQEDFDPSARLSEDKSDLARISTALLVGESELPLFDGFLLLRSEESNGVATPLELIPDRLAQPTIPGFYWQHIAYVVIWFLMALITLYLPFYQRRRTRLMKGDLEKSAGNSEVPR